VGVTIGCARGTARSNSDGTGTKSYTASLGGLTPEAFILIAGVADTNGTAEDNQIFMVGFAEKSGGAEMSTGIGNLDGVTSPEVGCCNHTGRVLYLPEADESPTAILNATVNSWDTNGVTLNFGVTPVETDNVFLHFIFFAGTSVSAKIESIDLGTGTTAFEVDTVGFQPDCVFMISNGSSDGAPLTRQHAYHSFGFATSSTQGGIGFTCKDTATGSSRSELYSAQMNGSEFASTDWEVAISGFDANGFSLTPSANAGADHIFYLALEFDGQINTTVTQRNSPTSTGDWAISDLGWTPQAVLLIVTDHDTLDSHETNGIGQFGIGFASATDAEFCYSTATEQGVGTQNCQTMSNDSLVHYADDTGSLRHSGALSSFDSGGYTVNFPTTVDTGTTRKWLEIAFEEDAAGAQDIAGSLHTNNNDIFHGQISFNQDIEGTLLSDADNLYHGEIATTFDIEGSLFVDTDALFHGEIATTFNIQGSLFIDQDDLFHGLVSPQILEGSLFSDADQLYHGEITAGIADIEGSLFVDVDALFHGEIAATYDIEGSLFVDADELYHGLVSPQILEGSLFTDADELYHGEVIAGIADIEGSLFSDADILYHGLISLDIAGSLFVDADELYHGTLDLILFGSLFADPDDLFHGEITTTAATQNVESSLFVDTDTLFHGEIATTFDIESSLFVDTDALFHGEITRIACEQEGFRWRDDDNDEANATWLQSQDVDHSIAAETNIRLRIIVNGQDDPDPAQYTLEYKKSTDPDTSWRKVPVP
jgi:hypothetical protein